MKQAWKIDGTPLSISLYSVKSTPAEMCGMGREEIVLCLKGSVNISYVYRGVTLHMGEFVSINHDACYMSGVEDNLCVSFYIDTDWYEEKYPDIKYRQHICVGAYSDIYTPIMGYPTAETDNMLGMLLTLLYYYVNGGSVQEIKQMTNQILESLVEDFDVIYFMNGNRDLKECVHRNITGMSAYVYEHYEERYTQERIADLLGISPNYVNEYLKKAGMDLKMLRDFAKIYAAERMLIGTDKTVLEISEDAGFRGSRYMYSAFNTRLGCTPKEFRNRFCKERKTDIKYYTPEVLKGMLEEEMIRHFLRYFARIKNY